MKAVLQKVPNLQDEYEKHIFENNFTSPGSQWAKYTVSISCDGLKKKNENAAL